jgi:hypothetical protein
MTQVDRGERQKGELATDRICPFTLLLQGVPTSDGHLETGMVTRSHLFVFEPPQS